MSEEGAGKPGSSSNVLTLNKSSEKKNAFQEYIQVTLNSMSGSYIADSFRSNNSVQEDNSRDISRDLETYIYN